jgi:hypothetical protein
MLSRDGLGLAVRSAGPKFDEQLVGRLLVGDDSRLSIRRQRLRRRTHSKHNDEQNDVQARPTEAACHLLLSQSRCPERALMFARIIPKTRATGQVISRADYEKTPCAGR